MRILLTTCLLLIFVALHGQDYSALEEVRIALTRLNNLDSVERKEDLENYGMN